MALFDESSFAKLMVTGPDAAALLEWVCDNRVARGVGDITYTQALNVRGGIESDFTVTRVADDEFLVVTGTAFGNHDAAWLRRQARRRDAAVRVDDVTGALVTYALWGPRSRDLLRGLTGADLSNAAFPFMTAQEISVADVPVRALRVTFTGELGWELYAPAEYGLGLWTTLWEAGREHGLVAGGYRAIESLRLEKGYRVWSTDITPETTPYEAGLGFCVKLDKPGGFEGREALVAREGAGAVPPALLPHAGRPGRGGARRRAGAGRRRGARPGHLRRLRLHRGRPDRLRVPARRGRDAGHRGRGERVRRVGRRCGVRPAAGRPGGHPDPRRRLTTSTLTCMPGTS